MPRHSAARDIMRSDDRSLRWDVKLDSDSATACPKQLKFYNSEAVRFLGEITNWSLGTRLLATRKMCAIRLLPIRTKLQHILFSRPLSPDLKKKLPAFHILAGRVTSPFLWRRSFNRRFASRLASSTCVSFSSCWGSNRRQVIY